jgi:hypothetical protein
MQSGGEAYIVVSSPPATEEIGAMGREIESRQGWQLFNMEKIYHNPSI